MSILKRILEIQDLAKIDLTGVNQYGLKKNHSASTLSVKVQSLIVRALEDEVFC
jgi:hypothetical protein